MNVETGDKFFEQDGREAFSKDISKLLRGGDVKDTNVTKLDLVTNKMNIDLNMLCLLVLNVISSKIDGADIVTINQDRLKRWTVQL